MVCECTMGGMYGGDAGVGMLLLIMQGNNDKVQHM